MARLMSLEEDLIPYSFQEKGACHVSHGSTIVGKEAERARGKPRLQTSLGFLRER